MKVTVNHLKYSQKAQSLYVRILEPSLLKRATLQIAVRRALGLTLPPDIRQQPESMLFSAIDYQGEHDLAKLSVESFNRIIEGYGPVQAIAKTGVFEVQAVLGLGQSLSPQECGQLPRQLGGGVTAAAMHSYLGGVLALTVLGLDDGPNTSVVHNIGAKLCLWLDDNTL